MLGQTIFVVLSFDSSRLSAYTQWNHGTFHVNSCDFIFDPCDLSADPRVRPGPLDPPHHRRACGVATPRARASYDRRDPESWAGSPGPGALYRATLRAVASKL